MANKLSKEVEEVEDEEEDAAQSIEYWEKKQRELLTSVVDYNLSTLTDLINGKDIDLSPSYQRRERWDDIRKSALIESFLINVPVPPIFLNEDQYGEYSIIDGKQRLTAIHDFLSGALRLSGLKIFSELNDKTFHELPARLQSVIKTRPTLRAIIILRQSDEDVKFEVFRRLNTGGIKLNNQEIRNSVNPGRFNDMLLQVSEDATFHRLLGIKAKSLSTLYQKMGDVEMALRFFAFRENWEHFNGGIVKHLDKYMADNRNMSKREVSVAKKDFLRTVEVIDELWGDKAFRRWNPKTNKWRSAIVGSLLDAQMVACRNIDPAKAAKHSANVVEEFQKLFDDEDFQKSLLSSIPSYFKLRISRVKGIISRVVV